MKVKFVTDFEARTTSGTRSIPAGSVLDLADDKARKLIAAGVAKIFEAIPFNPDSLPFLDHRGRLVIPFDCPPKYRYWAGGQSVRDTLQEIFEERAAIMEIDGGLSRDRAEDESAKILNKHIREVPEIK